VATNHGVRNNVLAINRKNAVDCRIKTVSNRRIMSQLGSCSPTLRLRVESGELTASWLQSSIGSDSYDTVALIIAVRFTEPLETPSSPYSIDIASLSRAVGYSLVQITAQLCGRVPGTPKGWKVAETATVMADVGSDADEHLANLLYHQLSLSFPSSSFPFALLSVKCRPIGK